MPPHYFNENCYVRINHLYDDIYTNQTCTYCWAVILYVFGFISDPKVEEDKFLYHALLPLLAVFGLRGIKLYVGNGPASS